MHQYPSTTIPTIPFIATVLTIGKDALLRPVFMIFPCILLKSDMAQVFSLGRRIAHGYNGY